MANDHSKLLNGNVVMMTAAPSSQPFPRALPTTITTTTTPSPRFVASRIPSARSHQLPSPTFSSTSTLPLSTSCCESLSLTPSSHRSSPSHHYSSSPPSLASFSPTDGIAISHPVSQSHRLSMRLCVPACIEIRGDVEKGVPPPSSPPPRLSVRSTDPMLDGEMDPSCKGMGPRLDLTALLSIVRRLLFETNATLRSLQNEVVIRKMLIVCAPLLARCTAENVATLDQIAHMFFDRVTKNAECGKSYAHLAALLASEQARVHTPESCRECGGGKGTRCGQGVFHPKVSFRRLILDRCQRQFESIPRTDGLVEDHAQMVLSFHFRRQCRTMAFVLELYRYGHVSRSTIAQIARQLANPPTSGGLMEVRLRTHLLAMVSKKFNNNSAH